MIDITTKTIIDTAIETTNTPPKRNPIFFKAEMRVRGQTGPLSSITLELRHVPARQDIDHNVYGDDYRTIELSLVGDIKNQCVGQCQDDIRALFKDSETIQRICDIWDRWHMNTLKAGCAHQTIGSCMDDAVMSQVCGETGYRYGSAWLFEPLPAEIVEEIKQLFRTSN